MLEGPAGIGSSPVLLRDQTLVCSFNVLILSVVWNLFLDCFLHLFLLSLSTPNMNVTDLPQLIRWHQHWWLAVHAAHAVLGEVLLGTGIVCWCAAWAPRLRFGIGLVPKRDRRAEFTPAVQFNPSEAKKNPNQTPNRAKVRWGLVVVLLVDIPISFCTKTTSFVGSQCSVNA